VGVGELARIARSHVTVVDLFLNGAGLPRPKHKPFQDQMSTTTGQSSSESREPKLPPADHGDSEPEGHGKRRRRRIQAGSPFLGVIAAGVFGYWFLFMRGIVFTDDARFAVTWSTSPRKSTVD